MIIACKMLKQEAALAVVGALVVLQLQSVAGHGYVLDPPQRSTMWRVGYDTPANYNDNQLFCGGFSRQWGANGGKCGICGDPYDAQEKPNEAGGKYATGIIVKTYNQSQTINVTVKITANHKGYFLFKLCPNNDVTKEATQECLDQHVLQFVDSADRPAGSKFYIDQSLGLHHVRLQLPSDVTCRQCVLQWTYNTGNSWGCDNTGCGIGKGPQENFVNCVDVAIRAGDGSNSGDPTTRAPTPTATTTTTKKPPVTTTTKKPATTNTTTAATTTTTTTTKKPPVTTTTKKPATTTTTTAATTTTTTTKKPPETTTTKKPATTTTTATTTATRQTTTTMRPATTTTSRLATTTRRPTTTTTRNPDPRGPLQCVAVGVWTTSPGMTQWCNTVCNHHPPYCPASHCSCQ